MNSFKKKYVIYTAIIGDYDEVPCYSVTDDRFDYILFSDTIESGRVGIWEVRPIPYTNEVKTKIARWVKTHPEELLPEYDYSLWLDACVTIKSSYVYERCFSLTKTYSLISTNPNPDVICIFQEMCSMMYLKWERDDVIIDWGKFLRKEQYPRWFGSCESWLLFRKHSDNRIMSFDSKWWWCIENYSRRDQLSFYYVLWKLDLNVVPFLPIGIDIRNNDCVEWQNHSNAKNKIVGGKSCHLMRYYRKHVDERVKIENVLYWIYGRKYPFVWLSVIGLFYRLKHLVLYCLGRDNNTDYLAELDRMRKQNFG